MCFYRLWLKRDSNTGAFLWILLNFKNTYFGEHLQTAAFEREALMYY